MSKRISGFIVFLFLSACATTHPGSVGQSIGAQAKLPLKISAENIDAGKSDSFQLVDVTLENTSESWLKISKAEVLIANPAEEKLSVVLGEDLKGWADASRSKQLLDQQNDKMMRLGLVGVGAAAMLGGGNSKAPGLANAGALAVVGTSSWAVADTINASINEAQRSSKIPDNHLYHQASIPSKMFLRRWVLINKPVGQVLNKIVIQFETVEGEKETYAINL